MVVDSGSTQCPSDVSSQRVPFRLVGAGLSREFTVPGVGELMLYAQAEDGGVVFELHLKNVSFVPGGSSYL